MGNRIKFVFILQNLRYFTILGGENMFGRLGGTELLIILVVGFLIFGPKKLPEIGKSFGDTVREFKKSSKGLENEIKEAIEE